MPRMQHTRFAAGGALAMAASILAAGLAPVSARQRQAPIGANETITVLKPARVFDGDAMHEGWAVRVRGEKIDAVGADAGVSAAGARVIDLPGATLMPGLVEGHSHILLHSYNEASWTDQVGPSNSGYSAAN